MSDCEGRQGHFLSLPTSPITQAPPTGRLEVKVSRLVRHHLTRLASLSHPHPVTPPHPHIHYQSVNPFYSYIYSFVHPTLSLYSSFQYTSSSHPHHFTPSLTLTHQPLASAGATPKTPSGRPQSRFGPTNDSSDFCFCTKRVYMWT